MTGSPDRSFADDPLLQQIAPERLMEHVTQIARWVRLSGSDDERRAFDYIAGVLTAFGLASERHHPVCLVSLPGPARLTISGLPDAAPCITHSFASPTPPEGVTAPLIDVGHGAERDYAGRDVAGKIGLAEGLATPKKALVAEGYGLVGMVHVSGEQLHEMTLSPVWGSPTPETVSLLPTIPHVSITTDTAGEIRRRLQQGGVEATIHAEVDTAWQPLPLLVAQIDAPRSDGTFVLFSGHVDSWYHGAMDNGSANAAMLEIARLLASARHTLRRDARLAFWSGHSHARYATSAWYADEYWQELHERCVAHVNVDSPGAINATVLSAAPTMAETYPLARRVIADLTGQQLRYRRIGRLGDQSFWGAGVPSLYCSISEQDVSERRSGSGDLLGGSSARGGGLGWWWHTPDDTVDKIDPDFLVRDTRVLLATLLALTRDRVLPIDQTGAVREILDRVREAGATAPAGVDLSRLLAETTQLLDATEALERRRPDATLTDRDAERLNRCAMRMSRLLIPINYTVSGPFDQDLAIDVGVVPGLTTTGVPAGTHGDGSDHLAATRLRRERNRLLGAIRAARETVEQTMASLDGA